MIRQNPFGWTETHSSFYEALGAFIAEFSITEFLMADIAKHLTKMPQEYHNAAYPSLRLKETIDLINRLLEARNQEAVVVRIKPLMEQLGLINTMRNNLLHWGAHNTEGTEFQVSNVGFAMKSRERAFAITAEALHGARIDLRIIQVLMWQATEKKPPKPPKDDPQWYERLWRVPWRYKLVPRPARVSKKPKKPPKPKPPRGSSRGK